MNFHRFAGNAQTAIDEKGRTAFPREFRRQLGDDEKENLVISCGPEGSLRLFIYAEYERFMAELDNMPDRRQAEIVRGKMLTTRVTLDSQNRILIPKRLLDKAGLKGEGFWIPSHGKTLAMWNPETYNAKFPQDTEESQAIFDSVFYGQGLTGNSNART